jgi:predicted outer membrane repeat protein
MAGVFINGFSEDFGGAITLINSTLHLWITQISSNTANIGGGGMYLNNSFLNVTDCAFRYNYVKSNYLSGGGIYSENSRISINISHLNDNFADEGAALYSINSNVEIYRSLIYNNYANWYGGAIVSDSRLYIKCIKNLW